MGKLYLAYGSNLNRLQMVRRCKDARVKGKVLLNGYGPVAACQKT